MTEPLDSFNVDNWDSADQSHIPGKSNDSDCKNWSNVSDLGGTNQSLLNDDSLIEDDDFFIVQDSALAKLNLQLTESERKLIDEFYEEMEGVRKSLYDSNTESALERIKWITDKYLKEGIRLNSRDDDRDKTVTNFIFEEIVGVLDSVVYINFSTVAPERSNSFNNESQDCDDADEISSKSLKIIKKIASNLLLKGGKVRRDLFCHGRIGYATTAFVGNNNSLQFNEYIAAQCKEIENDLKNIAYESIVNKNKQTQKDELEVEIDNGYFYIEYPQGSIIEVVKILNNEKAKDLNLRVSILKIGESTVRVESIGEKRNYTDLADNSDIALTFNTSEGELEVRLYPDMRNKDLIRVEVRSAEAIKNCNEEIGKNCLLGGLSVNEAIEQGYFKKPGKLCQSSETTSPSNKIVEEEKLQRGNNYWQDKEVQRSMEKEEGGKRR